jgi:hypothetical protein
MTSKDVIVKIISAVKNYRTPLGVKFVDRELEVEKVINEEEKAIFNGMINVLYGPKGCGKTTLFRALQSTIELEDLGVDVLYAAGEYEETPQLINLYIPKTLGEVFKEIASTIGGSIEVGFRDLNVISAPITFFKAAKVIVESIVKKLRKKRRVIVVIDEVRADSEEHLSNFRGWLEVFANDIGYINLDYKDKTGGSIAIIALVSDALVAEIRHIIGPKVTWSFMWNLPRKAVKELAEELHLNIDIDTLWKLTGGNPRALHVIAIQGVEKWFKEEILKDVRNLYRDALEIFRDREVTWRELERATCNIDDASISLLRSMLRRNMAIYIGAATPLSELPINEPWIKEDYAYQIPAYYYTLRTMISKKSINITLNSVLNNL